MSLKILNREDELLVQVAKGNKKAFEQLFYAYYNKLGHFAFGWTKSMQTTEEIVHDIFLKVWLNRESLPEVTNIESYLYILTRNHTFNILRKLSQENLKKQEWAVHFKSNLESEEQSLLEAHIPLIEKAIESLPPQQQKVFFLKKYQGLKYDEISRQLNISPETARKHVAAAIRNITTFIRSNKEIFSIIYTTPVFFQ